MGRNWADRVRYKEDLTRVKENRPLLSTTLKRKGIKLVMLPKRERVINNFSYHTVVGKRTTRKRLKIVDDVKGREYKRTKENAWQPKE